MIVRNLFRPRAAAPLTPAVFPEYSISSGGMAINSGKRVTPETAKSLATAYRCGNILSDDIAQMPLQVFRKNGRTIEQVAPDGMMRNLAYLLEVQPNRRTTPFILKKTLVQWLLYWGNAYVWQPAQARELYVLMADRTWPAFDLDGNLWYQTLFPDGSLETLPAVEVAHVMINSTDGVEGRSVLTYACETMGRQLGAHETQDRIQGNGLNPAAVLWVNGDINSEARAKLKATYSREIGGSENGGGLAVFDNKIVKFEPVSLKPVDAQFLESIQATDVDIANFFGMPLYKLNQGKQSYESNSQQDLDYIKTTLNPYLVQIEQEARLKWLSRAEQGNTYLRFIREALLQTDAKTRSEYLERQVLSGQMTPNEARQVNDMSAYPGGDGHYIPANMALVGADGALQTGGTPNA